MYLSRRTKRGSGIVETAAGLILVIPVLLCLLDVAALVIAQTANDALAKQCARAGAEQPLDQGLVTAAATTAYTRFADSSLVQKSNLLVKPLDNANQTVTCETTIVCKLPVPVPFGGPATQTFVATATEPVVGQAP
jgi:hypothetical protein